MALTEQQIEQFRADGYLLLRGMVPAGTCDRMRAVAEEQAQSAAGPIEYEAEVGYPGAPPSLDAPGGRTARRLRGAYHRHAAFREWAQAPELVSMLSRLLGEPVCLSLAHHNCIMTKHPHFGTATGWHRDIRYWRFTRPDLITSWLALGRENAANGALQFIPGSHRLQIAPDQLDSLDFLRQELPQNQALFAQGITPELEKGDVILFHSGLFHAAGTNDSPRVKMSVAFAYRGESNLPLPGTRSASAGDIFLGS